MIATSGKCLNCGSSAAACWNITLALNKQLRKQLHALIPAIQAESHVGTPAAGGGRISRYLAAHRDHAPYPSGLVTARDQFAIDTTVYNMYEINAIAGKIRQSGHDAGLAGQFFIKTGSADLARPEDAHPGGANAPGIPGGRTALDLVDPPV